MAFYKISSVITALFFSVSLSRLYDKILRELLQTATRELPESLMLTFPNRVRFMLRAGFY